MEARPVFVYGTLRAGEPNAWLVADVACAAPAWLEGHALHGHGLAFPYATAQPGARVRGELLWPPAGREDELLARLDRLEGFVGDGEPRNHYDRVVRTCRLDDGTAVDAWAYLAGPGARDWLATRSAHVVASGDWRDANRGG